jgi:hypothetical protein
LLLGYKCHTLAFLDHFGLIPSASMDGLQNGPAAPYEGGADTQPGVDAARVIPQEVWERHMKEIKRLKLNQKWRLAQIRELMEVNHGFQAT